MISLRKLFSPNISSISSRRCAYMWLSMCRKIVPSFFKSWAGKREHIAHHGQILLAALPPVVVSRQGEGRRTGLMPLCAHAHFHIKPPAGVKRRIEIHRLHALAIAREKLLTAGGQFRLNQRACALPAHLPLGGAADIGTSHCRPSVLRITRLAAPVCVPFYLLYCFLPPVARCFPPAPRAQTKHPPSLAAKADASVHPFFCAEFPRLSGGYRHLFLGHGPHARNAKVIAPMLSFVQTVGSS